MAKFRDLFRGWGVRGPRASTKCGPPINVFFLHPSIKHNITFAK